MKARHEGIARLLGAVMMSAALAGMLLPTEARAQYVDPDDNMRFAEEFKTDEFMVLARMRAVKVPDFVLGLWFDQHASHWSDGQNNFSYGAEFVWRKGKEYEFSLGVDYADLTMPSSFWTESGKSATSAEYTEVDMKIVSVVFSTYWFWDVQDWFAPFIGGGIGPGIIMGDIVKYKARAGHECFGNLGTPRPAQCFSADGNPNPDAIDLENPKVEDSIPVVIPMINITGGMRFNIGRHAVLKLETGFYTYLYAGLSLGGQW